MISCRHATERLSRARDGQLGRGERVLLFVHLAICSGCRRYRKQVRLLERALRERLGPEATLDDAARERIRKELNAAS